MFGPLPQLHRLLVVLTAVVVGVGSGLWMAQFFSLPAAAVSGTLWGAIAGIGLGYVLLHDFHHRPRTVKVRRH